MSLQEELSKFQFTKKGFIRIGDDNLSLTFDLPKDSEQLEGNVYLWVTELNEELTEIIYIGKAGGTLLRRCLQHKGGFNGGSPTGTRNAERLLQILNSGKNISLWVRHSEKTTILFQDNISLCEAEEKALIKKYKSVYKLLNKI
jgi:hypothetical protein